MNLILAGLLAYLSLMLVVGAWISRRIHSEEDYLVAGRAMGPLLVGASVFATWFGAETVMGASGLIYTDGLAGGSSDPFGYGLALIGGALFFAVPLWRRKLTTFADLFRQRYSIGVERLMVLVYLPASVLWAAAQIRAFGQVVGAVSGIDLDAAIVLAAAFAVVYTLLGGLLADAVTDLIQSVALVIGLVVIWFAVVDEAGGLSASLALVEPERFQPFGSGGRSVLEVLEEWSVPVVGSMVTMEIMQRMIAARSPGVARWGTMGGAGLYLLFGLIPVYLGLAGPQLVPGLADPEQLVPTLARAYLGPVAFVMFAGAIVSITLSTVDSALLAAGGMVSHNLLAPLAPNLSDRGRLLAARASVFVFGVAATIVATGDQSIYDLVYLASAFGSTGFFVVACFALFSRAGGPPAAYASFGAGLAVWAYGDFVADWTAPFVVSLGAALATYVVVAAVESRRRPPEPAG
jgi:Na+/proline symporter